MSFNLLGLLAPLLVGFCEEGWAFPSRFQVSRSFAGRGACPQRPWAGLKGSVGLDRDQPFMAARFCECAWNIPTSPSFASVIPAPGPVGFPQWSVSATGIARV